MNHCLSLSKKLLTSKSTDIALKRLKEAQRGQQKKTLSQFRPIFDLSLTQIPPDFSTFASGGQPGFRRGTNPQMRGLAHLMTQYDTMEFHRNSIEILWF